MLRHRVYTVERNGAGKGTVPTIQRETRPSKIHLKPVSRQSFLKEKIGPQIAEAPRNRHWGFV
jgi:hypothetical protein